MSAPAANTTDWELMAMAAMVRIRMEIAVAAVGARYAIRKQVNAARHQADLRHLRAVAVFRLSRMYDRGGV